MPPDRAVEAELYASHSQFYVADPEAQARAGVVWDGAGLERHVGVTDGLVAVGTVGDCFLPVRLELWDGEPPVGIDDWDHVVEASLEVRSGRIVLAGVEGEADLAPIEVEAGTYRVRSAAVGLDDADELDGGDSYRVQIWRAPHAEPAVLKWWPPWDPAAVVPAPTTASGRLLVGAEAEEARRGMSWLASRDGRHLFGDAGGRFWEHSNLPDAGGTPQLEELTESEAESRYPDPSTWGTTRYVRPRARFLARDLWAAWRRSRRRPS